MGLPYHKIFAQAVSLVRTKKSLWGLGLFLLWGNVINGWALVYREPSQVDYQKTGSFAEEWLNFHPVTEISISVVVLLGLILLFAYYLLARAAIVIAVKDLMDKKAVSFKDVMRKARPFSSRVIKIWLLTTLFTFVVVLALSLPVVYLASMGFDFRALVLALMALAIFIPIVVLTNFINIFGVMFAVVFNLNTRDCIKASFDLVARQWVALLVFGVAIAIISVLGFFVSLLFSVAVGLLFVFLSKMPYYIGAYDPSALLMGFGITLGSVIFLWLQAIITSFQQTSWILVFLELVRGKKTEEAEQEALVAPEVVS